MSTPESEPQAPFPAGPQNTGAVPPQPNSAPGASAPPPAPPQASYPGYASPAPTPPGYNPAAGYPQQQWNVPPNQPYPGTAPTYPPGYPNAYPAAEPVPPKSRWLGRIALIVVAVTTIVATISMGPLADLTVQLMIASGSTEITGEEFADAAMASAPGATMALQFSMWIGMAAAITGLVAAIVNRGRATGIFALVLGLLAPVIMIIYTVIIMFPQLRQY